MRETLRSQDANSIEFKCSCGFTTYPTDPDAFREVLSLHYVAAVADAKEKIPGEYRLRVDEFSTTRYVDSHHQCVAHFPTSPRETSYKPLSELVFTYCS